jgi:hypothetical protein
MSGDKCATCGKGLTFLFPADGSARRLVHDDAEATEVCAPAVPVVPGERVGCLPHNEVDCERCSLLETRHRLNIESYDERPERDLGGCLIGLMLFVFMIVCVTSATGAAVRLWGHL